MCAQLLSHLDLQTEKLPIFLSIIYKQSPASWWSWWNAFTCVSPKVCLWGKTLHFLFTEHRLWSMENILCVQPLRHPPSTWSCHWALVHMAYFLPYISPIATTILSPQLPPCGSSKLPRQLLWAAADSEHFIFTTPSLLNAFICL